MVNKCGVVTAMQKCLLYKRPVVVAKPVVEKKKNKKEEESEAEEETKVESSNGDGRRKAIDMLNEEIK